MRLFGTNGIRGVIGEEFTPDFLVKVGLAIGSYLAQGATVAIGRDTRVSGDMVKNAVLSGLLATGVNVVDIGIAPTPAVQYYTKNHADFGLVITASHNPPRFNGVKAVAGDGTELPRREEQKIEKLFELESFRVVEWNSTGKYSQDNRANREYIEKIKSLVDAESIKAANFKVALDCANGASCFTSPYLLEELGVKVVSLNCQPDGTFPGHESEPTPNNLKELVEFMKNSEDFALGIAHDGDADRVIFVDEHGNFVYGDKTLALVAKEIVKEHGGTVVTPVSSSLAVERVVRSAGGELVYTRVGAPIVARKMIEINAIFGGEENGGLIFPEMQYCRDGAMGLAKILEIMATQKKRLSELVAELPTFYQDKVTVKCPNEKKEKVLDALRMRHADDNIITLDGVKIMGDGWWVLLRPSGTEPIYRIYAEAESREKVDELVEKYTDELEEIIASV